jgi:2-polyprenyl-3-methyl-5-hydroxy-6-metoxy-1,4-benzoquinol methylase
MKIELKKLKLSAGLDEDPEFAELKRLVYTDQWQEAVDPDLLCFNEKDKMERAEGILEIMYETTSPGKILDFGCGEGHVVKIAKNGSVGYDREKNEKWGEECTNDWETVKKNAPYDSILLHDVIDHTKENAELNKIKSVLKKDGLIMVRTHPWCSKTGGHLYEKLNKAYIHLVFTAEELSSMGLVYKKSRKIIHPILSYAKIFDELGWVKKEKEQIYRETVSPFFQTNDLIAKRIKSNWKDSPDPNLKSGISFPVAQMEQQFIKYVLSIK